MKTGLSGVALRFWARFRGGYIVCEKKGNKVSIVSLNISQSTNENLEKRMDCR